MENQKVKMLTTQDVEKIITEWVHHPYNNKEEIRELAETIVKKVNQIENLTDFLIREDLQAKFKIKIKKILKDDFKFKINNINGLVKNILMFKKYGYNYKYITSARRNFLGLKKTITETLKGKLRNLTNFMGGIIEIDDKDAELFIKFEQLTNKIEKDLLKLEKMIIENKGKL